MSTPKSLSFALAILMVLVCCPVVLAQPTTLDVKVKLTDLDYKPLPDVPMRVVFGCDKDWQDPDTGHKLVTDANGEGAFTATVTLAKHMRKRQTSFIDRMVSIPQQANHLSIGAQMEYMNRPFLYTVDVVSFAGGDSMLDDFSVYTADKKGRFTRRTQQDKDGWNIKDLDGTVLAAPGYEPWKYALQPDPDDPRHQHWTLQLAFKSLPSPVVH